ncbi:MAG: hypothetical protein WBV59_13025 [Anaerolineae bacterium]
MPDMFDAYQKALTQLRAALGSGHPDYGDVLLYEQRLTENMRSARRFGDTDALRAERAQVIDGLNRLALQHAGRSFNELAFSAPPEPPPPSPPVRPSETDTRAVRALLTDALSDEELTTLCFDHFRPVYDQFSTGMARTAKIQHLLEYAEKRQQVARLIELVEDLNPAQAAAHRGRLRRGAVVLGDVNTGGGAIVNGDVSTGGDFVGRDRH